MLRWSFQGSVLRCPVLGIAGSCALFVACAAESAASAPPTAPAPAPSPISVGGTGLSSAASVRLWLESSGPLGAEPFWLGARLQAPKGTHLYWQNPGESGLATTAEFAAPPELELSDVHYPGPVRFQSERGATSYGYLEQTALLVRVTPVAGLPQATIRVRASWLSCGTVCVKEDGEASLTLTRASPEAAAPSLASFVQALPEPALGFSVEWSSPAVFLLRGPPGLRVLEYFPMDAFGPDDRAPSSTPQADGSLAVELRRATPPSHVRGVVLAESVGTSRYFELDLAPP